MTTERAPPTVSHWRRHNLVAVAEATCIRGGGAESGAGDNRTRKPSPNCRMMATPRPGEGRRHPSSRRVGWAVG